MNQVDAETMDRAISVEQARQITEESKALQKIKWRADVFKAIESTASKGATELDVRFLSKELINELTELGYDVRSSVIGAGFTISWGA